MNRRVLVTGASSGIGLATVERLLESGWEVIGLSRRKVELAHERFTSLCVDLSSESAVKATISEISQIDAIVHAAGVMGSAELGNLDATLSQKLWWLHVHVAEILANHYVHSLPEGGRIVLVGSRTSRGAAGRSQYVATKAAMVSMARSWAAELAGKGITVNVVAPGATATPMLNQPGRKSSPPKLPPIGRFIEPKEVAGLINFVLSPEAGAITGQELMICGGASL